MAASSHLAWLPLKHSLRNKGQKESSRVFPKKSCCSKNCDERSVTITIKDWNWWNKTYIQSFSCKFIQSGYMACPFNHATTQTRRNFINWIWPKTSTNVQQKASQIESRLVLRTLGLPWEDKSIFAKQKKSLRCENGMGARSEEEKRAILEWFFNSQFNGCC